MNLTRNDSMTAKDGPPDGPLRDATRPPERKPLTEEVIKRIVDLTKCLCPWRAAGAHRPTGRAQSEAGIHVRDLSFASRSLGVGQGASRSGSDHHDSAAAHNRLVDSQRYMTCAQSGRWGCRSALGAPGPHQGRPQPLPICTQLRPEAYHTCSPVVRRLARPLSC